MHFLSEPNIKLLWDVIYDEDIVRQSNNVENIYTVFLNNIKEYYEKEGKFSNNLVEINKKYILLILNHVMREHQTDKHQPIQEQPQQLWGHTTETHESIHSNKRKQFDKELNKHQQEFDKYMTIKKPPVPNFSDDLKNMDKISDMEKEIKQLMEERNYDISQINKGLNQKIPIINNNPVNNPVNNIRKIKIEDPIHIDNNIIDLQKKVTWDNNTSEELSLFKKMKKLPSDSERIAVLEKNMQIIQEQLTSILQKINEKEESREEEKEGLYSSL